jgi:aminotransferase
MNASPIARHVQAIPRSGIRDFFEVVQTMSDVISLGIGEPDFVTPWHIREAAMYSLERGHTGYTSNLGLPKLRDQIAGYVARHFDVQYDAQTEVLVSVGVSEALDLALRALIDPGDEVLYHEPCYVSYSPSIALAHGVPVAIETRAEDGFALRAEAVSARITPRSKVLLLNFPTNPTGATLPPRELEAIAAVCRRHDLIVVTDEIYSELTYDGESHRSIASLPGMKERTIFLHGFSKAFAMTGFRIGYACAPAPLTEAMMKIHQYGILCASITSQEAAIEALRNGEPEVGKMRREYEGRRNFIVNAFNGLGLCCPRPRGAFYVFPDIRSSGLGSRDFSLRLLKEKKVAVVPGTAFGAGGEGYVRCSYATGLEQLKTAVQRIGEFLAEIRAMGSSRL